MTRCSVRTAVAAALVLLLLGAACAPAPAIQVTPAPSATATPLTSWRLEVSPAEPQARQIVTVRVVPEGADSATSGRLAFSIVCMFCDGTGRLPPPTGVVPQRVTGTLEREAGSSAYSAKVLFPQAGSWRVEFTGVDLPKPDPVISVFDRCGPLRARVLGGTSIILRADRSESKRTTVRDLLAVVPQLALPEMSPDMLVCVAAVAGDIRQPAGVIDLPHFRWAIYVARFAPDDSIFYSQYNSDGAWPAYFDALPDH